MKRLCYLCVAPVLAFSLPMAAKAGSATTTLPVSATVLSVCSVTANPLIFGNYDPTSSTNLDVDATLNVLCTQGTSFFVALDAGTTSGATVTTRAMTSGSNVLNYSLYQDVSRTANWGNTAGGNTPAATTASTLINPLTVHGRIPKNQNAPAGSYSDTITVTVSY